MEEDRKNINPEENTENEAIDEGEKLWGNTYTLEEWNDIVKQYQGGTQQQREEAGAKAYQALAPFVNATAYKYYAPYMPRYGDDIVQEGLTGMIEGLGSYIPSAGKPTTWFFRSIIHRMRDYVDSQIHHTSPFFRKNIRDIEKCIRALQAAGRQGSLEEVQIATGISRTTLDSCYTIAKRNADATSIYEPIGKDGDATFGDLLPAKTLGPEAAYIEKEKQAAMLQDMKELLDDDEIEILTQIYGLSDGEGVSAARLERESGYNKQEIKEIRNRAEEKLRSAWSRKNEHDEERRMRCVRFDHDAGIVPGAEELRKSLSSFSEGDQSVENFDLFSAIVDEDSRNFDQSAADSPY